MQCNSHTEIWRNFNVFSSSAGISEESTLRFIFVEKNEMLKKKLLKSPDLYCMPGEMEENGKTINYMTIIY